MTNTSEWKSVDRLVDKLKDEFGLAPSTVVVTGSGLGEIAGIIDKKKSIDTSKFSNWPNSTVEGHESKILFGKLGGKKLAVFQGRVHLYEGFSAHEVVRPVRAAVAWGVKNVILTNSSGGIQPGFDPSSLMLISDHINMTAQNPLVGFNDDKKGLRFPDLTDLYDSKLRKIAMQSANDADVKLLEGVYAGMLGPSYETQAEIRMLTKLGCHSVGMSTVAEAIAAFHMGARITAVSCISNKASGIYGSVLNHDDVQRFARKASHDLSKFLREFIPRIA